MRVHVKKMYKADMSNVKCKQKKIKRLPLKVQKAMRYRKDKDL